MALVADSPEMGRLIEEMHDEYVQAAYNPKPLDMEVVTRWLTYFYDTTPVPEIMVARSRVHALREANKRTGRNDRTLDRWGPGDVHWVAWRDFGVRIGELPADDPDVRGLLAFRDFMRCAWDTVALGRVAIVVPHPSELHVDEDGNLHCATGPAIRWDDEDQEYAWHGTFIPERMIRDPQSYTADEFVALVNTEERRALGEILGWGAIASLLGATVTDSWTDPNTGLAYDLMSAGDRRFLRKQSPLLKAHASPTYYEPVHQDLRTAQAARKWQAVTGATAEECEQDPVLTYGVET